jgi:oxygen-independent coproporphyrinogen-3 oxidase
MDHFAKPNDTLAVAQRNRTLYRNFQGYSTRSGADLYGFGMSSIGHFDGVYAQNAKTLPEYYTALDAGLPATHAGYHMSQDDRLRKHVIMRLMCDLELDTVDIERRFMIDFDEYFSPSLDELLPFADDGLVELSPGKVVVTESGRLLLRNIAMAFDAYLDTVQKERPVFSRTV